MECNHNWKLGRGSNDHPCKYCSKFPHLSLRYQCSSCLIESCKFCLQENNIQIENIREEIGQFDNRAIELRISDLETKMIELRLEIQNMKNKIDNLELLLRNVNGTTTSL